VRHFWGGSAIEISGDIGSIFHRSSARARGTGAIYAKHCLSGWIVSKGLLAPLLKALSMRGGTKAIAYWAGTFAGRIQGLFGWSLKQEKARNSQ
jgi:hypothetical protein